MKNTDRIIKPLGLIVLAFGLLIWPNFADAQDEELPVYLRDRGTGVPSSMFATYIERGELVVYLFYEYYYDHNAEYSPEELGFGLDEDFRGKGRAHEGLIFIGYGITDWLIVELEAAVITETLETADEDPTAVPDKIEESGLGDVEGQIRWRWLTEKKRRPEVFSYFETVLPLQPDRVLIGTQDWEFKLGTGITKGSAFGTFTVRAAAEFDTGESKLEFGEYAVEYVKRLSRLFRVYLGVEGSQDEVELITELQVHPADFLTIKLNNSVGLTSKAEDWAPEVGLMFSFFK